MLKGKIYLQKIVNENEYRVGDTLTINILKRNDEETKYLLMKKSGQDTNNLETALNLKENLLLSERDFVNLSEKNIYVGRVLHTTDSYVSNMKTLIIEVEQ